MAFTIRRAFSPIRRDSGSSLHRRADRAVAHDANLVTGSIDRRGERRAAIEIDTAAFRERGKPGHGDGRLCVLHVARGSLRFDAEERMRQRDREGSRGHLEIDTAADRDRRAREHVGVRARQTKTGDRSVKRQIAGLSGDRGGHAVDGDVLRAQGPDIERRVDVGGVERAAHLSLSGQRLPGEIGPELHLRCGRRRNRSPPCAQRG